MSSKKVLLFVCVENANRSQMAEAFARIHGGEHVEPYSAGSKPSGVVNPRAIEFMAEKGYDLSKHDSKTLESFNGKPVEVGNHGLWRCMSTGCRKSSRGMANSRPQTLACG